MRIVPIPCLKDNYAYLVIDEARREAAVVDPSEAEPVERALQREGVRPVALWLTHHHFDHVGGVEGLADRYPGIEVLGSVHDQGEKRIPRQTRALAEGDRLEHAGQTVHILEIPGHTLGAIAFVAPGDVFTGDTLFLAGCGRVFEGTMEMMSQSLDKLRALPDATRVWCGHEYTVKNLQFARTVEPDNDDVARVLARAEEQRGREQPTVPGTLGEERRVNPFLRFDLPAVAKGRNAVESFTALREAKDRF